MSTQEEEHPCVSSSSSSSSDTPCVLIFSFFSLTSTGNPCRIGQMDCFTFVFYVGNILGYD